MVVDPSVKALEANCPFVIPAVADKLDVVSPVAAKGIEIFVVPSKGTPLIVRAVSSAVALAAKFAVLA